MKPMLAVKLPSLKLPCSPAIVQPKLNGVRALWLPEEGRLVTRTGKPIHSCGHIVRAIKESSLKHLNLDGELYIHGVAFQHISGMARRHSLCPELQYHVFDVVDVLLPTWRRLQQINFPVSPLIKPVPSVRITHEEDLQAFFKHFLDEGYEGIIVRHPDKPYNEGRHAGYLWKHKPALQMECILMGLAKPKQAASRNNGTFGSLILRASNGKLFACAGLKDHDREYIAENWPRLFGSKVLVLYDALSEDGTPLMPRFEYILKEASNERLQMA